MFFWDRYKKWSGIWQEEIDSISMRIQYVIKLDFKSLSVCGIRPNVTSLREKSYIHTSFKVKKKTEAIINLGDMEHW